MVERQVGVRLSVIDGGKAKAELVSFGADGEAALDRIRRATAPAGAGLRVVGAVAAETRGSFEGFGDNAGLAGTALRAIGPAGAIAAGAFGLVALAMTRGIADFAEAERVSTRLEAVLKATGYSAGLTGDQIDGFADSLEKSTMATAERVKEASGVLATFRSISGDTFTRTIALAQDLSAVFGQSLSSSATQLGKALENPEQGLTALSRVGVTFTATQKSLIEEMIRTGDAAGYQKAILDTLEQQVGGAGASEASGLTGAFKRSADALGNLFEEMVKATGAGQGLGVVLDSLVTKNADFVTRLLKGKQLSEQIVAANGKLVSAQDQLKAAQDLANNTKMDVDRQAVATWQKEVARLEADVNGLIQKAQSEVGDRETAAAGKAQAEADARTEKAMDRLREMNKEIATIGTPAEKIAAVRSALAGTVEELNKLRNPDGSNGSTVDDAIRAAEDLAERRVAAITKGNTELTSARNKTQREAERVFEGTRTAVEAYALEMERLNALLKVGKIDQETYARAALQVQATLDGSATDAASGFGRAIKGYLAGIGDMASQVEDATLGALMGIEDAIVSVATTGKMEFKDLALSIVSDLLRIQIRQNITGPLASSLQGALGGVGGMFGNLLGGGSSGSLGTFSGMARGLGTGAGIWHSGGLGTEPNAMRSVDPALFSGAPRYHTGHDPLGLMAGEKAAIIKDDEGVFTSGQMRAMGARMNAAPNVTVHVENTAPNTRVDVGTPSSGKDGSVLIKAVVREAVANIVADIKNRGDVARSIEGAYGAKRSVG